MMTPTLLVKTANTLRMPPVQANGRPFVPLADIQRQAWGEAPRSSVASLPYAVGHWAGRKYNDLAGHQWWGDSSPWRGATQFGLGGAAASAGLGALYNQFAPFLGTRELPVGGLAALGGLLGGWFGHNRASTIQQRSHVAP